MMPPSPNVASTPPAPEPAASPDASVAVPDQRPHLWIRRLDLFLGVMVRLYLGLILVFLPWTRFWTYNRFLLYYAPIAHLTQSGAFRGIVSGLGLLNLWIALAEAIHYKES